MKMLMLICIFLVAVTLAQMDQFISPHVILFRDDPHRLSLPMEMNVNSKTGAVTFMNRELRTDGRRLFEFPVHNYKGCTGGRRCAGVSNA
ncbi:hypothetical protein evm_009761 [Chilo suppressalis]|nr:hypothetical protein evm_009761 [Chilo suppressalis]